MEHVYGGQTGLEGPLGLVSGDEESCCEDNNDVIINFAFDVFETAGKAPNMSDPCLHGLFLILICCEEACKDHGFPGQEYGFLYAVLGFCWFSPL